MSLPDNVRNILKSVGQAAIEVHCEVEGCREFVSIYMISNETFRNSSSRFPYFSHSNILYRACRFRVRSELIEQDIDIAPEDQWDLQSIYIADEEILQQILSMWQVEPSLLGRPVECAIPV